MFRDTFLHAILIFMVLQVFAMLAKPVQAQQAEEITINVKGTENVDVRGNAHVQWVMNFTAARGYDRIKRI